MFCLGGWGVVYLNSIEEGATMADHSAADHRAAGWSLPLAFFLLLMNRRPCRSEIHLAAAQQWSAKTVSI